MKKILFVALVTGILCTVLSFTESFTLKGKVLDEKGLPVSNATVSLKNTNSSTFTDAKGEFSLVISDTKTTIVITAIGFETQEVVLKDKSYVTIIMKKSSSASKQVKISEQSAKNDLQLLTSRMGIERRSPGYNSTGGLYDNRIGNKGGRNIENFNREGYDNISENKFLKTTDNPLSTFSIDVDAASYSNVRRIINNGSIPPAGAVRIEELINYFKYDYPEPTGKDPFSINTEIAVCPWKPEHRLVSIGLQAKKIPTDKLPSSNLTFLIDVSGSMSQWNRLPLVKSSLKLLVDQLREQDKVSIVVYAGNAGVVLTPTSGGDKIKIKNAIDNLEAGGSTAGGQGIKLAYKIAKENFVKNGNNRVILCTDGDFNVGASSDDELERLIEEERKSGVFLTVLGYGIGNYQDAKMQKLANKGNGNHGYIDDLMEAKKVLVNEFGGTLFTLAKDVKLQVEFNPAKVQGYRLIGYENRMLAKEDFNNDTKDAGELGSGHTVTALYEVIPAGIKTAAFDKVDSLKYQKTQSKITTDFAGELMNIKVRYKQPDKDVSELVEHAVVESKKRIEEASENLRFAAAIAQFGMLLRNSDFKGSSSYDSIKQLAKSALGKDVEGYRKEFIQILDKAVVLSKDVAVQSKD